MQQIHKTQSFKYSIKVMNHNPRILGVSFWDEKERWSSVESWKWEPGEQI